MNIYEYLQGRYPEASKSLANGAVNAFLRRYSGCGNIGYVPDRVEPGDFFDVLVEKSDEELLTLRNMGINKVRFLKQALKDWDEETGIERVESMLHIRNVQVYDLEDSIRASKFPMSVDPDSESSIEGDRQDKLAQCKPGTGHDNFLQGIRVAFDMDITAKALVEAERYHFFDIVSSTSTMHRITKFDLDKCYCKYVDAGMRVVMKRLVNAYNDDPSDENYLKILYSNPAGFIYTIRFTTNYRQLKTIYIQRKNHRLPEWREFCKWIETLPHNEWITEKEETLNAANFVV